MNPYEKESDDSQDGLSETSISLELCKVCQDPIDPHNRNTNQALELCSACIKFLDHNKVIYQTLKILLNKHCVINTNTRTDCGACRFAKIIANNKFPQSVH